MAEGRSPEREPWHEDDVHHDCNCQSGKGYPEGHIGRSGKFIPHGDIEQHAEEHIREQHDRDHAHSRAEIFSDNQCENIQIEELNLLIP